MKSVEECSSNYGSYWPSVCCLGFLVNRDISLWIIFRDACKYTHIEYQWEKIKPPCFEKNVRYEGPRLETLTGYNVRTHVLCQVCPVSTISNMYENWFVFRITVTWRLIVGFGPGGFGSTKNLNVSCWVTKLIQLRSLVEFPGKENASRLNEYT